MALTRKKKIIIAVSAVAVLALIIIISVFASRKDEAEVTTVKLEVKPELRQTVTASGEVRPIRYIKLTSEVPGRIEEIYVNPGDQVTQGKPLVRVDPTQLQSSQEAQWAAAQQAMNDIQSARNAVASSQQGLVVAEASVASARQQLVALQTSVDRAQVDLNTAQRELKRYSDLIESGVASRSRGTGPAKGRDGADAGQGRGAHPCRSCTHAHRRRRQQHRSGCAAHRFRGHGAHAARVRARVWSTAAGLAAHGASGGARRGASCLSSPRQDNPVRRLSGIDRQRRLRIQHTRRRIDGVDRHLAVRVVRHVGELAARVYRHGGGTIAGGVGRLHGGQLSIFI